VVKVHFVRGRTVELQIQTFGRPPEAGGGGFKRKTSKKRRLVGERRGGRHLLLYKKREKTFQNPRTIMEKKSEKPDRKSRAALLGCEREKKEKKV